MKLKKYEPFFKDLFLNTFSFAIYILAQQILFMPLMGKMLSEDMFANFVIYISIFSILTNSLGNELGITSQVIKTDEDDYKYIKLLLVTSCITAIISFVGCIILKFSFIDCVMLSIAMFLANVRLFIGGYFRKYKLFKNVLVQNAFYMVGMIIGLIIFYYKRIIFIPSILAEAFSLIYSLSKYNIIKFLSKNTIVDTKIIKGFSSFSFVSFLGNMLTYFDKIMIYPILGTYAVNVYYSTSTMSKIVNMVINPIHGVLLTWINKGDNDYNKKIIIKAIKASLVFIIISILISIPVTYLAVKMLYGQYFLSSKTIVFPISLALGFSVGMTIIKSFVMKFIKTKELVFMYILYILIFIICSIIMSNKLGIIGFAYSSFIAKLFIYLEFIVCLYNACKRGDFSEK